MLILLISKQKVYFCARENCVIYDVITTDMKSAGIHLLNCHSFRPTQPFLLLDTFYRKYFDIRCPCSLIAYIFLWGFFSSSTKSVVNDTSAMSHDPQTHGDLFWLLPIIITVVIILIASLFIYFCWRRGKYI